MAQLRAVGALDADQEAAAQRLEAHLSLERPWREIASLQPDLTALGEAYTAERRRPLEWQEREAAQARGRVRARSGFSTLTADQSHRVLRPIALALTSTTAEAVAPTLAALKDPFRLALQSAEEEANETLDQILSEGTRPLIVKVDLSLRNREITTEVEVNTLVEEIRRRLLERVKVRARVRIV